MTKVIDEPIVGIGTGSKDPVLEKLDILIEGQEALQDLIEELVDKFNDLDISTTIGYNAGYE